MQHILYIDDSGTKEFASGEKEYTRHGRGVSRYFVFGGILLSESGSGHLVTAIKVLKQKFFGTHQVEIKSNWLRIPSERGKQYLTKFGISEADLSAFVDELYRCILASDLLALAVAIDKPYYQEEYGSSAWYPPAIAYELLLQRAVQEILAPDGLSVVVDDMSGATPKGNQYKHNLRLHHASLRKNGSKLQKKVRFTSLNTDIKFVNSACSHQVQVADLVAYNVYRQFSPYSLGACLGEHANIAEAPAYPWLKKLLPKFRADLKGKVQGYGLIAFPLEKKDSWVFLNPEEGATTP
jgi:hypothetical protein